MKKIILIALVALMSGCASTQELTKQTQALSYDDRPADKLIIAQAALLIKPELKDPDSLKNLHINQAYQCYASNMNFTDNVSPKYDYGFWCYDFSYQATNSYGGYVRGKRFAVYADSRLQSIREINETVRKQDDTTVWHSPQE